MQGFRARLPVALADVSCAGNETSLLDCPSDDSAVRACGAVRPVRDALAAFPDHTTLACINTSMSATPARAPCEAIYSSRPPRWQRRHPVDSEAAPCCNPERRAQ